MSAKMGLRSGFTRDETDHGIAATGYEMQHTMKSVDHARVQETNAETPEYRGPDYTYEDQNDMRRLGKKQELRRNFRFTSILGFVAIAMGTWEVILSATAGGLTNGGTGGMVWMFVGSYFCFGTIVLSLAEMSSMAPTAGGQYRKLEARFLNRRSDTDDCADWASEFAPRR